MLSLAARRQLPNRPFLAALRDLIASDPRTPDGAQILRWIDVGPGAPGGFVVLEPEALAALFPVWFPAKSEMPWNRRRRYDFDRFVTDVTRCGFGVWRDDESDAEDESITFTNALFGPASGDDQFRQMVRERGPYFPGSQPPRASQLRRRLLAGEGGVVQLRRLASGRFRVSRAGEARRAHYREALAEVRAAKAREREERARAAQQQSDFKEFSDVLVCFVFLCFSLVCFASLAWGVWRRWSFGETPSRWQRALLLVLGLVTMEVGEQGCHFFYDHMPRSLVKSSQWTGRYAALFALFGCLPALFVFGLFSSVVAFQEWSFRTERDHLSDVPTVIFMTGFVVGHWWQGRGAECAGLSALFVGLYSLIERLVRLAPPG